MISGKDFILVTVSDKGSFSNSDIKYKGTYILYKDKIKDILSYMVNIVVSYWLRIKYYGRPFFKSFLGTTLYW